MKRTIQLIQLLHATMLCHPELTEVQAGDSKPERYGKNRFKAVLNAISPIMQIIEKRMPDEMLDALYEEQNNTQILLNSVLEMNPEQTIEVIKAFKELGILQQNNQEGV